MPLTFLPQQADMALWGEPQPTHPLASEWIRCGRHAEVQLVVPPGRREVLSAWLLPLLEAVPLLAAVPAAALAELPASLATWCLASKLALDLAVRERMVPHASTEHGNSVVRWAAALSSAEDAAAVAALARSMPPAAHAVPATKQRAPEVWAADALLRAFLDTALDSLVRAEPGALPRPPSARQRAPCWEQRWLEALRGEEARFEPGGFAERTLLTELEAWAEPALGARDRLRACFRLELPEGESQTFLLRFLLQSPDDPSLLVPAEEVWGTTTRGLALLGRAFRDPQESLLHALGLAARLFPPLGASLTQPAPEHLEMSHHAAWAFLSESAAALAQAGFGVLLPAEFTPAGLRRLRLRMRVGGFYKVPGSASTGEFSLESVLQFTWEAALGEQVLSARELSALARHKIPLVRYRGQWVVVAPRELEQIRQRMASRGGELQAHEALRAALTGEVQVGGLPVEVRAEGAFAHALERLRSGAERNEEPPRSLRATLRPYQQRGLAWLRTLASLGLGACLADDMGLGKTVQLLAFLLARLEVVTLDERPTLLVAPTSVVGNWEREVERFAPTLSIVRHYGSPRARAPEEIPRHAKALVLTTYGLLRKDAKLLASVDWASVVLDEAQNIKNSASATARAARGLRAAHRFALTGTPMENRLAELWSILQFTNPGLLGPLATFLREYAVPIERYGNTEATERLRRLVGPFLLRRVKSDPAIIQDLPPKNEMKVVCTLTREQATLYKAKVDELMERIEQAEDMDRRGLVLALLTALKQICNHPAQYLGESEPLAGRSGKLARTTEMLEEALAAGDKALIFTQYREMGDRLVTHLGAALGTPVLFLHGGTPKGQRDELVRRFQEERGARLFVLSLKAGGTGLNLTAANHVFHYDRWWNPAVEDQATDRAWRIGQQRSVQVHKLVCAGTVEEKVDRLLESKRRLAASVLGAGEHWLTELSTTELRELVSLSGNAAIGSEEPDQEAAA